MALIPFQDYPSKMPVGIVGTWANMELQNARTAFAGVEMPCAIPVMVGAGPEEVLPLATGNRLIGFAVRTNDMLGTPTADGEATFRVGDLFAVADTGVLWVLAGAGVTQKGSVFYDPATRKYHGASATGRLPLPTVEFDTAATEGEPVGLRIRILPGAANVTVVA